MLNKKNLSDYIFIDIETKPAFDSFDKLSPLMQKIWLEKYHTKAFQKEIENLKKENAIKEYLISPNPNLISNLINEPFEFTLPTINEIYIKESGLHPEFAKIFCISFGVFDSNYEKIISTIWDSNEKILLENFITTLKHFGKKNLFGFNINEFDIPFILKRMWINGIVELYPPQLRLGDAKPWTVKHIDIMQCYKNFSWYAITFELLCEILGIPSPKDKFSNSNFTTLLINKTISETEGIAYCEKDVRALMDVALRLSSDDSNFFTK